MRGSFFQARREHGREREHVAVRVVQVVAGAAGVVGEEQEPDRDLRDEQRLGEREQLPRERRPASRRRAYTTTPAMPAAPQTATSEYASTRCASSIVAAPYRVRFT